MVVGPPNEFEGFAQTPIPIPEERFGEMISIFRSQSPKLKVVLGGALANMLHGSFIDYWVMGEADQSVVALADNLSGKNSNLLVENIGDKKVIKSNKSYPYENFHRSKIEWAKEDIIFNNEHLPLELSRGCIFRCAYCTYKKRDKEVPFYKDKNVLKDELIYNYENFGTTGYMFCDELYNDSIEKVQSLRDLFQELPFQIQWSSFMRLDLFVRYPEMRELILESGAKSVMFGIETMHEKAGRKVGKGLGGTRVKELLHFLKESWEDKISILGGFIVGLPEEPESSVRETLDWLLEADCPIDSFIYSPLRVRDYSADLADGTGYSFSKMSLDMEKYKMQGSAQSWQTEHMSIARANEIAKEIFHMPGFRKKQGSDFVLYNRLQNIGYTEEETRNFEFNHYFQEDYKIKEKAHRDEYMKRLLK